MLHRVMSEYSSGPPMADRQRYEEMGDELLAIWLTPAASCVRGCETSELAQ